MKEKIYKKGDKIIIEIDYWSKRFNPYAPDQDVGSYPTLTGMITKDESGNDELGFCQTIDMSYKGKGDQYTDIKYHFWRDKKEFEELCKDLGINIVYL